MRVLVTGFLGRMGSTSAKMVLDHEGFELVALVNTDLDQHVDEVTAWSKAAPVFASIEEAIEQVAIDVAIDFTVPAVAFTNTKYYIDHNIHPVIGTTGFTDAEIDQLTKLSAEKKLGGLIAPNFAIGSVLMQIFSAKAAKYLPDVEITEIHHNQKLDAPSGTAEKTAKLIYEARGEHVSGHPDEKETMPGARGADFHGVRIHSLRLPGYNSHQIVQFGGIGEALTIRQDSFDRSSYMPGVALAVEKVATLDGLVYGLEHLLDD
jgi:4-hydroxy-tetrahydrodipicolinate reductase